MIKIITLILSTLTLIADVLLIILLLSWLIDRIIRPDITKVWLEKSASFFKKNGLLLIFIVSLAATLGSLFFSEIAHYNPCKLCWFQRIFMYPQVILAGFGLYKKSKEIIFYHLPLSIIGGLIALYHYSEQIRAALRPLDPLAPCGLDGTSCATRYIFHYGYITIPMMALTAFILIILISYFSLRSQKSFPRNMF